MKYFRLILVLAGLLILLTGCCDKPGNFGKVKGAVGLVNGFYDFLVGQLGSPGSQVDDKVRLAVVAADTALALADVIEKQKCASAGQIEQLDLQAQAAQELAGQAGVK
ncbi:MAG: hypothetical protein FJ121_08910 [Deltaproteobacteria bacterium]|nr:hypothetical protein [Deltaproteobacteria bacterium]